MSFRPRQLALSLDHAESYAREDFLSGPCNEGALQLIDCWPDWPANAVALIGPEGAGKTHLAMMWAAVAGAVMVAKLQAWCRPHVGGRVIGQGWRNTRGFLGCQEGGAHSGSALGGR